MAENTVTMVGNVTSDPKLRFTSGGRSQVSFGLAVNRRYQVNNEWQEQTSFFNIVVWGDPTCENIVESVTKGMRVVVTGRLEQRSWETDGGEKRSTVEVVADEVAPSLRWARAKVTKVEREGGSQPQQRRQQASSAPASAPTEDPDERPF